MAVQPHRHSAVAGQLQVAHRFGGVVEEVKQVIEKPGHVEQANWLGVVPQLLPAWRRGHTWRARRQGLD
jgi:hypothetical protein